MVHDARFYIQLTDKNVHCQLCPHSCVLDDGAVGICKVRFNEGGVLKTMVYGEIASLAVDPIEKKPLFHFLPGANALSLATVGCNFHCDFCQNWQISQVEGGRRKLDYGRKVSPEQLVETAIREKCKVIAYTYNEPTIFLEYVYDTAYIAMIKDVKNVMVTNGYMTQEAVECIAPFVDAVNIDLKSSNEDFYRRYCGGHLQPVLDTIKLFHSKGVWVELTTLIIPGLNDSEEELNNIASFIANVSLDIPWHISRFFPQYKMTDREVTSGSKIDLAYEVGKKHGLRYIYPGNISREADTHCPECASAIIKRAGYAILETNIVDHCCSFCGKNIPGVYG